MRPDEDEEGGEDIRDANVCDCGRERVSGGPAEVARSFIVLWEDCLLSALTDGESGIERISGIGGTRDAREDDEVVDLESDLSVDEYEGGFIKVVERGRAPTPAADLVVLMGGEEVTGSEAAIGGDGEDGDVCEIPDMLVRWGGLDTTANEDKGCRSRMGVGIMRSLDFCSGS